MRVRVQKQIKHCKQTAWSHYKTLWVATGTVYTHRLAVEPSSSTT